MSNLTQQQSSLQPSPLSNALSQLRAIRIELAQTRERLLTLRTEVDSIIDGNRNDNSDDSLCRP
jgi:hypothetical protein